jgi:hypothetical protein
LGKYIPHPSHHSLASTVSSGGSVCIRRLHTDRNHSTLTNKLRTFLPSVLGRPYDIDLREMLMAGVRRHAGETEGLFCSQLVAGMRNLEREMLMICVEVMWNLS